MLILSLPALAATLRTLGGAVTPLPTPSVLEPHLLTPMYRVQQGDVEQEASSAARLVSDLAERLRRLTSAYGEWEEFEVEPYFDLYGEQTALLVHVSERVSTVHVTFYADAVLPSFQAAVDFLAQDLAPARFQNGAYATAQAVMSTHWQRLVDVVLRTREHLAHDAGFLAANGAGEERSRCRSAWQSSAPEGLLPALAPPLAETPTLTLSIEFPLPAYRQPGRLRRLRRAQQNRLRRAAQSRHSLANRHLKE
ncbi:MAG: hypothetical protein U0X20_19335 [Caldilineaceae bacterium]